ncbi:RICIN domain-containing protein [Streptomyces sp. NPDC090303]|uniref:golvesin C-terminal-like domain-containing protein n=1 Tax=Streptomyces sp. NPDC090303 TaxID=3365960 RepID=UPI00382D4EB8
MPSRGLYGVYYWIPDGNSSRADKAPFTVQDAEGSYTYSVDERAASGGKWILLGNHTFDEGTSGYVTMSNKGYGIVNADAVKLGPPGQESIELQIARAVAEGKNEVTITPGEYRRSSLLNLGALSGFTVHAEGVTLVQTRRTMALTTGKADNLTVEGLRINYDPLPFTQGRVVEVSPDRTSWMDVKISDGYARPATLNDRVTIFDPTRGLPTSQTLGAKVSWKDATAGIARASNAWSADVGDIVTFAGGPAEGPGFGITIDGAGTTLRNVWLYSAPGMGLMNATGEGDTHLDNFHIVPGPPPPGGTERPMLSTTWDAMQFQSVKKGPTIENSEVVNAGDDSMSIQGIGDFKVIKAEGRTVWVSIRDQYRRAQTGDRLQQWTDGPVATVTSMTAETDPAVRALAAAPDLAYRLTLDEESPWQAGAKITDIDRMGNGFVFRNNTIDSSARGLLLKARDGVIENNWIRGSSPVAVSSEIWSESDANAGGDLLLKGNTFVSALWSGGGPWDQCGIGAVVFEADAPRAVFPKVIIEDNTFKEIRGLNLNLTLVKDAVVRNNRFELPHQLTYSSGGNKCGNPHSSVIHVRRANGVTFEGNVVDRIGPYTKQVTSSADSTGIAGLPDGVAVESPYLATASGHTYALVHRASSSSLAVGQDGAAAAAALEAPAPSSRQGWRLEPAGQGTVRIEDPASGRVLASGTGSNLGWEEKSESSTRQQWELLDTANSTVRIRNTATGTVLASASTAAAPSLPVTLAAVSGTLGQSWKVEDVSVAWVSDSPPVTATTEDPYTYRFTASGASGVHYTVSAGSLPPGVTLDSASGLIGGTPTVAGTFTYTLSATNGYAVARGTPHTVDVTKPRTVNSPLTRIGELARHLHDLIERQIKALLKK